MRTRPCCWLIVPLILQFWTAPPLRAQGGRPCIMPVVSVVTPTPAGETRSLLLPGTLEPWADVKLYAKASGYVEVLAVDIGDEVRKGALLVRIAIPELRDELRRLEAEVRMAESQLALEELTGDRLAGIRAEEAGAVTQQDVDEAQARVAIARARVAQTEAAAARLETLIAYAEIRAPFSGLISERLIDVGDFVQSAADNSSASPVLRILDVDRIRVFVHVPEDQVPLVRVGTAAEIRLDALPSVPMKGQVTRFAGSLVPETRVMRTEITVPNADHRLRAGMYAHVTLQLHREDEVLHIPSTALTVRNGRSTVWVVEGERAHARPVLVGQDDGHMVEVREGLRPGDQVVVPGGPELHEGAHVQVRRAAP